MSGLIGKKIGMTSIFDESGKNVPCTVIQAGPCIVTQVRTDEIDGYNALQLGFDDKAEKNAVNAENAECCRNCQFTAKCTQLLHMQMMAITGIMRKWIICVRKTTGTAISTKNYHLWKP